MAKTKEELDELKNRYSILCSNLKELNEDELSQVVGGATCYEKEYFKTEDDVQFLFNVNDCVEVETMFMIGTVSCHITDRKIQYDVASSSGAPGMPGTAYHYEGYCDYYYCQEDETHWYFKNGWYNRNRIEKRKF